MKKISIFLVGIMCMTLTSCMTPGANGGANNTGSVLGAILGAATNANTIGNILTSVIGVDRPSAAELVGTWKYKQPGVAFTSDNLLAKAGGEVAASSIREKLVSTYQNMGIKSSNTYFTFKEDGTFTGKLDGKSLSGNYTYDQNNCLITMKTLLFTLPAYAKKSTAGMSFLFESTKLLQVMQTLSALSGNTSVQAIGELSKNYDGVRLGFDCSK